MLTIILNGLGTNSVPMRSSKAKRESAHKEIGNGEHILQQVHVVKAKATF
jgi:hypothetical protein